MTKGLSPIVATVLLVAFVVAIGGLVAIFGTTYVSGTQDFTLEKNEKLLDCAGSRLKVESVTGTGIIYSNPGVERITNITVYDQAGRNLTYNASNLETGQIGNLSWSKGSNTSIFMRGICQDAIVVEGECKDGQICWK